MNTLHIQIKNDEASVHDRAGQFEVISMNKSPRGVHYKPVAPCVQRKHN